MLQSSCLYPCDQSPATAYQVGFNGVRLVTAFEGFSSTCYLDSVGVWTIGYGHACQGPSDNLPEFGVVCTAGTCSGNLSESEAQEVLASDLAEFDECVRTRINVNITQNQFDAMTSFAFNVGCNGFETSTFLSLLNAGALTDAEAQYQLTRWHSDCLEGLKRRRYTESQLFSTCDELFACDSSSCTLSYGYTECESGCQHCQACGGCSGSTASLATCVFD